tara:strand:+ start:149 stop:727 length:579 start_codon:yes stop_codon:yes gene_type:complete
MFSEKLKGRRFGHFINGPLLLKPKVYEDSRGFFMESWNQKEFNQLLNQSINFVQDNHSRSSKGILRGLHYQIGNNPQAKLVRCVSGEIYDVIVDIRKGSETFGEWAGLNISAENKFQLWVPIGFAHGFITLSKTADVIYKTTSFWDAQNERIIKWNDTTIGIEWPKSFPRPYLSEKDAKAPYLKEITKDHLY